MLKPVWRMNTGNGVPSSLGGQLLYKGKSVQVPVYRAMYYELWRLHSSPAIYAYQTNRTKAAKYERVECGSCNNPRFKGLIYCGGYFEYTKCQDCKGKGYTLEPIK